MVDNFVLMNFRKCLTSIIKQKSSSLQMIYFHKKLQKYITYKNEHVRSFEAIQIQAILYEISSRTG